MTRYQSMRILIVDDEATVRQLVARALKREGFECQVAGDGDEALEFIEADEYDLIITDILMPNRHGHSLCTSVLSKSPRPSIVVLSAVSDKKIKDDLVTRGVDAVFEKPVDLTLFTANVRAILDERLEATAASSTAAV